jgi:hypothetical protein
MTLGRNYGIAMRVLSPDEGGAGGSAGGSDGDGGDTAAAGAGTDAADGLREGEGGNRGAAGGAGAWLQPFGPDLAAHPALTKFQKPEDLGRAYLNLEKKIVEKGLIPPKDDAPAEEKRAFYEALGAPADPKGYGVPDGWEKPQGFDLDQSIVDRMATAAHEAGVPKSAWDRLFAEFTAMQVDQAKELGERFGQAREQLVEGLRAEWGNAFDAKAKGALESAHYLFGDKYDDVSSVLLADGSKMIDHPQMIRALSRLHDAMGEGKMVEGVTRRSTMTPEEANDAYNRKMGDKDFLAAYLDESHPNHKNAMEEIRQIQAQRGNVSRAPREDTGASSGGGFQPGGFQTSRWNL